MPLRVPLDLAKFSHMHRFLPCLSSLLLALLFAGAAQAQGNCPEHKLSAACQTHTGCSFVLKGRGTCERSQAFLDRLSKVLGGRAEITNNDVFDAAQPA